MKSRTRKQVETICNFYKEAGLSNEIQNLYQKNSNSDNLSKKDRINQKKKIKLDQINKLQVKTMPDKQNSESSEQIQKQSITPTSNSNILSRANTQSTLPLQKMLNKISILQISEAKILNGCYGHTTVIFKRPIIQGKYYLEIKILKSNLGEGKAKIRSPPSIRLGVCIPQYPKNTPLGQDKSVCYKGSNGKFVYNGVQYQGGQPFQQGDVIGLCMNFSPPDKYQDKELFWEQSYIQIFKNGIEINKFSKLHQCFYCPAISLFNYANVQVRCDSNSFQYHHQGYFSYSGIFNQSINYEPLKNTATFAHLKIQQNDAK